MNCCVGDCEGNCWLENWGVCPNEGAFPCCGWGSEGTESDFSSEVRNEISSSLKKLVGGNLEEDTYNQKILFSQQVWVGLQIPKKIKYFELDEREPHRSSKGSKDIRKFFFAKSVVEWTAAGCLDFFGLFQPLLHPTTMSTL